MKKILAPLLLALLATSVATIATAHATDDQTQKSATERQLSIYTAPNLVLVRSHIQSGNTVNNFGLLFLTAHPTLDYPFWQHGIVIHVVFTQEENIDDVKDAENEAFFHMRIAYLNLVEFNDTNNNGAYDAGTDSVVQTIHLNELTYSQPTVTNMTASNGVHGWEIKSTGTLGQLSFSVTADVFPDYAVINNVIVQPTQTKITTSINDFPFQASQSLVALQVSAESKSVIEHETAMNEERMKIRSATAQGFFEISPIATVDGNTASPVKTTYERLGDTRHWIIDITFQHGASIVHDPVLGFSFGATPLLTGALLVGAAVASVSVFGLLVYAGRRQLARVFPRKLLFR